MNSYTGTCSEPALAGHTIESCEWETAVPQDPKDQRPGASARLDMVNVLGWLEGRDESRPGASQTSILVQAWVNNVAFAKDVWTDVYLVGDAGDVACRQALPLRFSEPAGDNGDCFVGDVVASRASSVSGSVSGQPRRLQFRLYYRVGEELFTDGLLHGHDLAGPDAGTGPPAGPSRRSLIISMLLLRQASARTRRGY
jgi:hypothetical protein